MRGIDPGAEDHLVEAAAAVADRTPVDWREAAERSPENSSALARLRELAALESGMAALREGAPGPVLFTWGPLQVLERIGAGSFAEVHRAWDPTLAREVALKLRHPGTDGGLGRRRWVEEARRLARVRHPHVLLVQGAGEHGGRAGLWTERILGTTLEEDLASRGPCAAGEAVALGIALCGAVAAVHAAGLVHGDISTRNVMREHGTGRVVLMDFGSARERESAMLSASGTPVYMAPEVLGGGDPGPRSDVYALGVVLYRMLSGAYPVEPGPVAMMRARLERGERIALRLRRPDLPPALVAAVEHALAVDPARRLADVAALERGLSGVRPRDARATRGIAVALAVAVVAMLAVQWWRGRPNDAPSPTADPAPPAARETKAQAGTAPAVPVPVVRAEAALVRVTAGGREDLRSGDMIAPGDALALEFTADEPLHVHLLSEDDAGVVHALFPLPDRGLANPLPAGRHRLPGGTTAPALAWQVTSAGGREHFLVLASREPLTPITEALAKVPHAAPGAVVDPPRLDAATLRRLRGVGGVTLREPLPQGAGASMLEQLARRLGAMGPEAGVWWRLVVLENPSP